ncbi:MAG: pilus assembly protein [Actinomycetia bacterium]|nr:pilus assembly protein [Actinomycetes bacterium]
MRARAVFQGVGSRSDESTCIRGREQLERESGAALVEAALILPFLLALFFAMVDFSIAMNDWNSVRQGSREGARQGSVFTTGGDSSCALAGGPAPNTATHELICLVKDRTQLGDADTRVKISFSDADGDSAITNADYVQGDGSIVVCVQYPVRSVSGMYTDLLGNRTVSSKVEIRLDDVNDPSSGEQPLRLFDETAHTSWAFCT